MTCLLCGNKLAIFRRLSIGDFCCPEHRALFLREQSDQGLARLIETKGESRNTKVESRNAKSTRVYAQFLPEELPASPDEGESLGYGPLAQPQVIGPETPRKSFSHLAPARALDFNPPPVGSMAPVGFGIAEPRVELPGSRKLVCNDAAFSRLTPAGWILPWSSEAGSHNTFSLSSLVAAAWAQSGNSKPICTQRQALGSIQFAWPGIAGSVEPPSLAMEMPAAAFAAFEKPAMQPMQVRISMPSVASHHPKLAMPAASPITEDIVTLEPVATPAPVERKPSLLSTLFTPSTPRPPRVRPRPRTGVRDDVFSYNEPAPTVSSSAGAWRAMFAGLTPSAGVASAAFAVLFLFSAIGIFLSAPSALSDRSPSWRWGNLREAIRGRAVLKVEDDFRSGLNRWIGPAGWSRDWSYDQAGFLRPGKLGFLQQSMSLVNYRLEFMGQIERKSLGWTFRAKDDLNYYVAKLTIAKPGPLPIVDLIHYQVTDGREGPKVKVTLPFSVRNDTLYQIEMNVKGDQFRASVNGHVVDSWSDKRLRAGGVGFTSGKGEASRVRWIRVSDKDDVIGRVCSYLTAHADFDQPTLSASYYTILQRPGSFSKF